MAEDALTAAEIEVLIGKRSTRSSRTAPQAHDGPDEKLSALLAPINDQAARQFAGELAALLRRTVHVRTGGIDAISAGALQLLIDNASYQRRIAVSPVANPWTLVFSADSLFPLIDCLLGGNGKASIVARRTPTEIESRLADRVLERLLVGLKTAWLPIAPLEFTLGATHRQATTTTAATTTATFAWCTFSIELAGVRGELALAIPADLLAEPTIVGRHVKKQTTDMTGHDVEVVACLTETTISADEVAELSLGDIIATEHRADRPINLTRDGQAVFHARLGSWHGRKALEIEQVVSDSHRNLGEESESDTDTQR